MFDFRIILILKTETRHFIPKIFETSMHNLEKWYFQWIKKSLHISRINLYQAFITELETVYLIIINVFSDHNEQHPNGTLKKQYFTLINKILF